MPRKNTGPRYFASKGGYYTEIRGVKHLLAKGPKDDPEMLALAEQRYHELMLSSPADLDGRKLTCRELWQRYLAAIKNHRKPATLILWRQILDAADATLGSLRAVDLKPYLVTAWLAVKEEERQHPTRGTTRWTDGTIRIALSVLKATFNWAVEQEILPKNPLARLKKPRAKSRGGEQLLTAAGHIQLYDAAPTTLKNFLLALHDTGARPGEVARVTAMDYNAAMGAWVLSDHKTERHGRRRVIYLTPRLVELTERLIQRHPHGPIFRNRCHRPWTLKTLDTAFQRMRRRLGLGEATPYSYRHLFATQFLLAGGSIAVLAELMGNTVGVVEHHYGHLREHGSQLRETLRQFRQPGG